jgi:hypothetical protein
LPGRRLPFCVGGTKNVRIVSLIAAAKMLNHRIEKGFHLIVPSPHMSRADDIWNNGPLRLNRSPIDYFEFIASAALSAARGLKRVRAMSANLR